MKKLLLILMITPLLFISCNKDDDTPDNNNNNNGTATFLENQDGTVWVLQNPNDAGLFQVSNGEYNLSNIGFYNANNFVFMKSALVNPTTCFYLYEGVGSTMQWGESSLDVTIVSHTSNELNMNLDGIYNGDNFSLEYKFSVTSSTANQMTIEVKCLNCEDGGYGVWGPTYNLLYVKSSTETNLACN